MCSQTIFLALNGYLGRGKTMYSPYNHRRDAQDSFAINYAEKDGIKEGISELLNYFKRGKVRHHKGTHA